MMPTKRQLAMLHVSDALRELYPEREEGSGGGFRKVGDWEQTPICRHPSHNPPGMIVLEPGHYEYECPGCGHVTRPKPTLAMRPKLPPAAMEWVKG